MKAFGLQVMVVCDLWDRAKGYQEIINGCVYQRSLCDTGRFQEFFSDYKEILSVLSRRYEIDYKIRLEEEFLMSEGMSDIVQSIIQERECLGKVLAPTGGALAIRAACPECGLVDKYGVNNRYSPDGTSVSFECPQHGRFARSIKAEPHKFQFNCQLFNLVLARYYQTVPYNYIEICGSDYAGFWQEQFLWRFLERPILIVYTPLIADWSGSKLSKSQYLREGAYEYLKQAGQEYLLSYQVFKAEKRNISVLWQEIEDWVDRPYKLFRAYTLHYLHLVFEKKRILLGITHE
jgi:hypothetical protein